MPEHTLFIQDLALVLLAAVFAGVICKRIGLSPVAGYLIAGIALAPTNAHSPVTNELTIRTFAQLGMVFLMFSIGLEFSLKRLKKLGIGVLLTTFLSATLVFCVVNLIGALIGIPQAQRMFLGAMLMICSSAIVSKILESTGIGNENSARVAMGMALCEDIVAVVILTLLGAYANIDQSDTSEIGLFGTIGLLIGFVLLTVIFGLFLIPAALRWLKNHGTPELETLFVAGILFGLAILAENLGYSLALGAFFIGAIFAETRRRHAIERAFSGLKDVFSAIFFVAVGMLIDLKEVPDVWYIILGVTLLALCARFFAVSTSLLIFGHPTQEALRAGLIILPLGEFSFIISALGVNAKLIPSSFNTVAVGASLLTSLLAPVIVRNRSAIVGMIGRVRAPALGQALSLYRRFLDDLDRHQRANRLWTALRPFLIQIALEFILISTLIIFSEDFARFIEDLATKLGLRHPVGLGTIGWYAVFAITLPILYMLWRNLMAACEIFAGAFGQISRFGPRGGHIAGTALKVGSITLLAAWFWSLIPHEDYPWYVGVGFAGILACIIFLLRRKFVRWYGDVEGNLQTRLSEDTERQGALESGAQGLGNVWNLSVQEFTLPDNTAHAGKTLAELRLRGEYGCSIASVERHGFLFENPRPELAVYPQDKLLILGAPDAFRKAAAFLGMESDENTRSLNDLGLETFRVPENRPWAGKTLLELQLPRRCGVQIVGVAKGGKTVVNPPADTTLESGDETVVFGTREQLKAFYEWLQQEATPDPVPHSER